MSKLSRRSLVSSAVALPALAAPAVAVAATSAVIDPIFAAIEEHRHAYDEVTGKVLHAFSEVEGRVGVGNEENPEWQAATLAKDEAEASSYQALNDLLETPPTTPAGAKALLDWLTLNLDRGDEWPMLRSPEVFELLKSSLERFA
jgi:hypothetical protein